MSNISTGPAGPAQWILFLALYRASYETANIGQVAPLEERSPAPPNDSLSALSTAEREWAEKAVQRYARAQGKKWRHWRESMFESVLPGCGVLPSNIGASMPDRPSGENKSGRNTA